MGKRSRRERREAQASRALAAGDVTELARLAQTSPGPAVQHVVAALEGSSGGTVAAGIIEVALDLVGSCKGTDKHVLARRVAEAGAAYSSALRLDAALMAFADDDDDAAARLAAGDATVCDVMAPLLAAARGEDAPRAPRSSVLARAVGALASAAACAARGDRAGARASLRQVPRDAAPELVRAELGAAINLALDDARLAPRASRTLAASTALRAERAVKLAAAGELARFAPAVALDAARRFGLPAGEVAAAGGSALLSTPPAAPGRAPADAALEVARRFGHAAFDEAARGTALLYEGFARVTHDPDGAMRCFDQAVEHGGDLVEALRGKLLALQRGEHCQECGVVHAGEPRAAAAAAERLARALRREPRAGALAAAAGELAARAWLTAGDNRAAARAAAEARSIAVGGAQHDALLALEAYALEAVDPARADALGEALIERSPDEVSGWRIKISAAERRGDDDAALGALFERAAEATSDATFRAEARRSRLARGASAPFDELAVGAATAGALAAELERARQVAAAAAGAAALGPLELPSVVVACREALDAPARVAFDAATVAIAALDGPEAAHERFVQLARGWTGSPRDLARIGAVVLAVEPRAVAAAACELAERDGSGPLLSALLDAALAASEAGVARRVIAIAARRWSRGEIARARALARFREPPPVLAPLRPDDVMRELDGLLAPDFSIAECVDAADEPEHEAAMEHIGESALAALAVDLGLPPEGLARLHPTERAIFASELLALFEQGYRPDVPAKMEAFTRRLEAAIRASARIEVPAGRARSSRRQTSRGAR